MSANFLLSHWLKGHWRNYAEGKTKAGKTADPADWRIARTIFVADDDRVAERYARTDPASPYRFYWDKLLGNMVRSKRHVVYKRHESEDDSAVTLERLMDELVIAGSVDRVVDEILRLRSQAGDFGELVYANMDWVDPQLARRSMELMATEVMPRVNRELGC
jgi:alkanesulfonate monooxygenase SsuD/methylene tetrahydromethanopterin reductase-like flavin-dependent oxidoreductase (luciferase family)